MSSAGMPDPMAKRFGYALKRAQHALRLRVDDALRPLGLTAPQYAVLSAVELDAGISNASLARAAFVTAQSMHGVLANLIRDGLLLRERDPAHGRILRSSLTTSGRRVLIEAHARVREIENIMIAAIGAKEAKRLAAVLSNCADRLADHHRTGENGFERSALR